MARSYDGRWSFEQRSCFVCTGVRAQIMLSGENSADVNCAELVKGKLNMYWTVGQDQVADIVLEGTLPTAATDSYYLSYGYSRAGASGSQMIGGTAIVGGLVNGECFGYDYFLDGEIECNYAGGYGTCPTYVFNGNKQGGAAELVECQTKNGVLAVRMRKPLGVDVEGLPGTAWPLDGSKYAMYAMGSVGQSTPEQPEIRLHSIETPKRPGLKVSLGVPQNSCPAPLGAVQVAQGSPSGTDPAVVAPSVTNETVPVAIDPPTPIVAPATVVDQGESGKDHDDDDHGESGKDHDDDDHGESGNDHDDHDHGEGGTSAGVIPTETTTTKDTGAPIVIPKLCVMTINGEVVPFQTCTTVANVGSNFNIAWNLTADPNDPLVTIMTMGMNASLSGQYVAVGFPSKKNSMKNAATMILADNTSGSSLKQYYMSGYDESDVYLSSEGAKILNVAPMSNGPDSNGVVAGMFTMSLPYTTPGLQNRRRRLFQSASPLSAYNMIFAAGDVRPNGSLRQHYDDGAGDVNLEDALVSNGFSVSNAVTYTENESAKVAHQVLMAIGWGVIIPLGIIGGRAKNQLKAPKWYNVHRYMQAFGYLIGLIGFGLGFAITQSWETNYTVHRDLGITITVLATVQVLSLLWKPQPGTKLRKYWAPYHMWVGRATTILAIVNIYYGMLCLGDQNVETWAWVTYTVVLGLIGLLGLFSEYREYTLRKSMALEKSTSAMEQGDGQFTTVQLADTDKASSAKASESSFEQ